MAGCAPTDFTRRSFVYRRLAAAGARFVPAGDQAVARDFGDPAAEAARARALGLADLSPLGRTGYRGPAALSWLASRGVRGLAHNNRADAQPGGAIAARLAPTEALILAGIDEAADPCAVLDRAHAAQDPAGCHRVMRNAASFHFVVAGVDGAALMARLCGVDLRSDAFPEGAVAQTPVAALSMIVIAAVLGATPVFHLLGDSTAAGYAWDALADSMTEFDGGPVGLAALRALARDGEG